MAKKKKEENKDAVVAQRIEDAIGALNKKDFTMFFFVVDSKNVPNGSMAYIYQLAKTLSDKEYNVKMLYQLDNEITDKEVAGLDPNSDPVGASNRFVGVREWLGDEYADLPHMNIQKEEWKVGPSDFLFIPEVFSSIMFQTYNLHIPCKRYVILHNFDYVTEFIPFGKQWANYGIKDVITNTQCNADLINQAFPYTKDSTYVLKPYLPAFFRPSAKAQNLTINVVAKNQDDVNRIVKNFYWRFPAYQFVSFVDLRSRPMEEFAERLKENAITVWCDDKTPFGYSGLAAIKCGSVLVGRIPENVPEWMNNDNGIWFNNINDVPEILSRLVGLFLADEMPQKLYEEMAKTAATHTFSEWSQSVDEMMERIVKSRIDELTAVQGVAKSHLVNNEKNSEEK